MDQFKVASRAEEVTLWIRERRRRLVLKSLPARLGDLRGASLEEEFEDQDKLNR